MSAAERYLVPASRHRVEETILRSRFITSVAPAPTLAEATAFVREVSAEFPDATHNCWAYLVGPPGTTTRIGMSDDGEPHGTAGRPMLHVLLHSDVGDVAAVVTRYYGGQKLGTGGLARAYSGGVQLALATLPRVERVELVPARLVVDYAQVSAVQQLLPTMEAEVVAQEYLERVTYQLELPRSRVEELRRAVLDVTRGQAELETPES
ncbi:MAG: YigZ family protein [Gemmatimonadaceae bacterium]